MKQVDEEEDLINPERMLLIKKKLDEIWRTFTNDATSNQSLLQIVREIELGMETLLKKRSILDPEAAAKKEYDYERDHRAKNAKA